MILKEKLKNLAEIINKHKVKSIVVLGLAGLVAVISLKDNVHFGAVRLHSPQRNHYALGVWPTIAITGEDVKGNFYSIGLLVGKDIAEPNSTITGDMKAYGLFGGKNSVGDNSTITGDIASRGCFAITPMRTGIGTNVEIGLKNYVVNKEKNK